MKSTSTNYIMRFKDRVITSQMLKDGTSESSIRKIIKQSYRGGYQKNISELKVLDAISSQFLI